MLEIDDNGIVTEYEKTIKKVTSVSNLINAIEAQKEYKTCLLPKKCILFREKNRVKNFIIEEFPINRIIKYKNIYKFEETVWCSLPFLYWKFIVIDNSITEVFVRCSYKRITSESDRVYIAPLLNLFDRGRNSMCFGNAVSVDVSLPIHKKIDQMLVKIWDSIWQHDLIPGFPEGFSEYNKLIEKWAEDKSSWASLKYIPSGTFGDFLSA